MDMAYNANLIAALIMALLTGVYIGRGYKARSDTKLREASELLMGDAEVGRELRLSVGRLRDQGRFLNRNIVSSITFGFSLPHDDAPYRCCITRSAPTDLEASL